GRRRVGEYAVRLSQCIARNGIVDDLRVVDAEPAANDGGSVPARIEDEAGAWSEVEYSVGQCLALVTYAAVQGQPREDGEIILHEERPELVIDKVVRITVALLVIRDLGDVIEVCAAFAYAGDLGADVVGEFAEEDRAAELLAVAAIVSCDDARAGRDLMPAETGGECVGKFILPVHEQRTL